MFKIFLIIFSLLISHLAHAGALVGDWAEFETRTHVLETGDKTSVISKETVLSVKNEDYVVWYEEVIDGKLVVAEERAKTRLMGINQGAEFVASCKYLGVNDDVTVPAGTFSSCKITDRELVIWYAAVPFAKAKLTYTLQKHQNGKVLTTEGTKDLLRYGHK